MHFIVHIVSLEVEYYHFPIALKHKHLCVLIISQNLTCDHLRTNLNIFKYLIEGYTRRDVWEGMQNLNFSIIPYFFSPRQIRGSSRWHEITPFAHNCLETHEDVHIFRQTIRIPSHTFTSRVHTLRRKLILCENSDLSTVFTIGLFFWVRLDALSVLISPFYLHHIHNISVKRLWFRKT